MYHRAVSSGAARSAFIATPAYQGVGAGYAFALAETVRALGAVGCGVETAIYAGDCHVDDARNRLVRQFLRSRCTDLVFIDADLRWEPADFVALLDYDLDVVGATYALKQDAPSFPVMRLPEATINDNVMEVEAVPTGFLRIKRHVLESMAADAPKYGGKADMEANTPLIFERALIDGTRWGGDTNFCRKWRATGGKVHLFVTPWLEHSGNAVWRDCYAAGLRRERGETMRFIAAGARQGTLTLDDLTEALAYAGNPWGADADVLMAVAQIAGDARGPILETGSGLSTVIMAAAAPNQTVWAIEHDRGWAEKTKALARQAGVGNIAIVHTPVIDGWYAIEDALPERFALGLNDGPPRSLGSRMPFYGAFGQACDVIVADDTDDRPYREAVAQWASDNGRKAQFAGRVGLIR